MSLENPEGPVCGNSILDPGEQCDDGNGQGGDGCSDTCQVEPGWECTLPVPANTTNLIQDPGFEAGPFAGIWEEFSKNFGTPICNPADCGISGQRSGTHWAWFGGISGTVEIGSVAQAITIPTTASDITFWLQIPECELAEDFVELQIDGSRVWARFGDDPACGVQSYEQVSVDLSPFADGGMHEIKFNSETNDFAVDWTSFFLDDIEFIHGPMTTTPSFCESIPGYIFDSGFE